ncbi:MAG TPA: NADP-dependent oxidoreductase [Polyangiales bacterium]|nr:NADP-dependent oxidoreductase [Polyangiales bacterium]
MKAVRFTEYGGTDVLQIVDVERPVVGPKQVLVQVKATGINPGEASIRSGALAARYPTKFPSGEGSDLAGVIAEVGNEVSGFQRGDEVIAFSEERSAHAEFVAVPAERLVAKPSRVSWDVAGSLFVVGTTAYAAVRAIGLRADDTVVVSGAAGGVGSIAVQLAKRIGAKVIGIAGEANHNWLTGKGVIPVSYGHELQDRIREAAGGRVSAFIDTFGADYVDLAIAMGVAPDRIDTIINFAAVEKYKIKSEGNAAAANVQVLGELAAMLDRGELEIPIAKVFPLAQVRDAYRLLELRHTHGKIVLQP